MTNTQNEQINITVNLLENPILLEKIEKRFYESVLVFNEAKEAEWLVRNIEPVLKKSPAFKENFPELYARYQKLINSAKLMTLQWLDEQEIIDLFSQHFSLALKRHENLEIWEQLRGLLIVRYPLDTRDAFKEKLRRALEKNQEKITQKPIFVRDKDVSPTMANWLRDYISHVNLAPADSIKQMEYLSSTVNSRRINAEEKKELKFLFGFYERLKLPTFSRYGLEEPLSTNIDGKEVTIKDGEVQEVDFKVKRLLEKFRKVGLITEKDKLPIGSDELSTNQISQGKTVKSTISKDKLPVRKSLISSAQNSASQRTVDMDHPGGEMSIMLNFVARPSRLYSNDVSNEYKKWKQNHTEKTRVANLLFGAIKRKNQSQALAAIRYLANSGGLISLIKDDRRFYDMLANHYKQSGQLDKMKSLHTSSSNPVYLKEFVRYILARGFNFSENESAHVAVDLVNLLRQKDSSLDHWAYFDEDTSQYHWV